MATLLDQPHPLMAFHFTIADTAADAVTDGVLAGGNGKGGPIVPTGYKFVPVFIDVETNDARTAGTATVKVTADGTELIGGPQALLDDTNTTTHSGSVTGDPDSVAAGEEIGVSSTEDASWAPVTADLDVVLYGYFKPA